MIKVQSKIEFLTIFGNAAAKNRAFGNIVIFLQQSFPFRRTFPIPSCGDYALTLQCKLKILLNNNQICCELLLILSKAIKIQMKNIKVETIMEKYSN